MNKEPPPSCPEEEFYDKDSERCSSELDDFGIRKINPTNMNSARPKPRFLGIGDWKNRAHKWKGTIRESECGTHLMNRWIGMKGIFYNIPDDNVRMELWLDKNANNDWGIEPVLAKLDDGGWKIKEDNDCEKPPKNECQGSIGEKITWGGPLVSFRWDNFTDVDVKYAPVREIMPPSDKFICRNPE